MGVADIEPVSETLSFSVSAKDSEELLFWFWDEVVADFKEEKMQKIVKTVLAVLMVLFFQGHPGYVEEENKYGTSDFLSFICFIADFYG